MLVKVLHEVVESYERSGPTNPSTGEHKFTLKQVVVVLVVAITSIVMEVVIKLKVYLNSFF